MLYNEYIRHFVCNCADLIIQNLSSVYDSFWSFITKIEIIR